MSTKSQRIQQKRENSRDVHLQNQPLSMRDEKISKIRLLKTQNRRIKRRWLRAVFVNEWAFYKFHRENLRYNRAFGYAYTVWPEKEKKKVHWSERQQQSWTSFTHVPNFWARFPLIAREVFLSPDELRWRFVNGTSIVGARAKVQVECRGK
jgi:hypothetical protein